MTRDELHYIDWYGLKQMRDKLPAGIKTFSVKYAIDWLPTGSRLLQQGHIVTECIHCGLYEDTTHLLQCLRRSEKIPSFLQRFSDILISTKTEQKLQATLIYFVSNYFREATNLQQPNYGELVDAVQEQEKIGWHEFTKGFWSKKWRAYQELYEQKERIKDNKWAITIMSERKNASIK
jgi:hypothetical protein